LPEADKGLAGAAATRRRTRLDLAGLAVMALPSLCRLIFAGRPDRKEL